MFKVTSTCDNCGRPFEHYQSVKRRFCSLACRNATQQREMLAGTRHRPTKPKRGTETPCQVCGNPVYANKSQRESGEGRYCSIECSAVARSKEPVSKPCAYCDKEMQLKPSQAHVQYCSKACEASARTKRPLERHHNGKPARKDDQGYVMVYEPDHPNRSFKGWQYEHRIVAERGLGRYLGSDEHVHHINGIKDDNRPENLQVMSAIDHSRLTVREIREQIERERAELAEYRRRYGNLSKDK